MGEPAHDDLVARDHLLPVDAEVLPRLVRPARHREPPCDQRRDVVRPAGLHRQSREIDVGAFPHDLLAWRRAALLGRHVHHLQEHGPRVLPRVLQALRRLGLLQEREQLADFAQRFHRVFAHPHRDAARRAEEIAEHRDRGLSLSACSKRSAGPAGLQHAVADLGHLEPGIDFGADALEFALALELGEEVAEVGVFHRKDARLRGLAISRGHGTKPGYGHRSWRRYNAECRPPGVNDARFVTRPPPRLRHRARELRSFVLPSYRTGGDRRRTHPGVRDQQRGAGHARGDLFLRLHAAADSRRRARRHAGSAADPLGRLD